MWQLTKISLLGRTKITPDGLILIEKLMFSQLGRTVPQINEVYSLSY